MFFLLALIGCATDVKQQQPSSKRVASQTSGWRISEQTDEMDHSHTRILSQSSSTSPALLEVRCSDKTRATKPGWRDRFTGIYFLQVGPIAWIYAGENGGKEKVRYKYEDDVIHEPFWFTGNSHEMFLVPDSRLLKEMLSHRNMSIEFSPGGTIAKFNLEGLSEALTSIQCTVGVR